MELSRFPIYSRCKDFSLQEALGAKQRNYGLASALGKSPVRHTVFIYTSPDMSLSAVDVVVNICDKLTLRLADTYLESD
jgi:hypothetical protein